MFCVFFYRIGNKRVVGHLFLYRFNVKSVFNWLYKYRKSK